MDPTAQSYPHGQDEQQLGLTTQTEMFCILYIYYTIITNNINHQISQLIWRWTRMNEWMNEWMNVHEQTNQRTSQRTNKQTNEWMNEWTNEQTNKRTNKPTNERTKEWMNEQANERTNKWTNEWTIEWMNKWMNKWMNGVVGLSNILTILQLNWHISFIFYCSCNYWKVMIIINGTENISLIINNCPQAGKHIGA